MADIAMIMTLKTNAARGVCYLNIMSFWEMCVFIFSQRCWILYGLYYTNSHRLSFDAKPAKP